MNRYAAGYISAESAWKLAYFRGVCSAEIVSQSVSSTSPARGTMMSVGLSDEEIQSFIATVNEEKRAFGVSVACNNSPRNVTVAGEDHLIDRLKTLLDQKSIFARKLRVPVAYHSAQMEECAAKYESMIGDLTPPSPRHDHDQAIMISSVTGQRVSVHQLLSPSYWSLNMVAPVQFSRAAAAVCASTPTDETIDGPMGHESTQLIEIGPHSALRGPLQEIIKYLPQENSISYSSILARGQSAHTTTLLVMGELHCKGTWLNLRAINEPSDILRATRKMLVDLPQYPFNHTRGYWHESRISRNYRLREHPPSEFIGVRSSDWQHSEPRWRHFIRTNEMPWCLDHNVNGNTLYPAAGMLVMAVEAMKQVTDDEELIEGYSLHDVDFVSAIDLTVNSGVVEVQTALKPTRYSKQTGTCCFEFTIRSYNTMRDEWALNCRGTVTAESSAGSDNWSRSKMQAQRQHFAEPFSAIISSQIGTKVSSQHMYASLKEYGLDFGPLFRIAHHQRYDAKLRQSVAEISLFRSTDEDHVIHPISLDAMFHLALTALTTGGSQRTATTVPSRIGTLWLSSRALSSPKRSTLNVCTKINEVSSRGFSSSGMALDSISDQVVAWYEGLSMTNVTSNPASGRSLENTGQFCMRMQCRPALAKLEPEETCALLESLHPSEPEDRDLWAQLGLLIELALNTLIASVDTDPSKMERWKPWKHHYMDWAKHYVAVLQRKHRRLGVEAMAPEGSSCLIQMADRLQKASHTSKIIATVASHLVELFNEDVSPLEVLLQSGILKDYYEELNSNSRLSQKSSFVDLLAHQRPGLNILEVGGGTGGGTRNILRKLRSSQPIDDNSAITLRCNRYDFTDVSPTLVDSAKHEFGRLYPQMTFGTLNIERDYVEQGIPEHEYDIVLAIHVLHIPSNLKDALRRVRNSLKVGGKLVLQESFDPSGATLSFIFGLFPGWWLGAGDGRTLSPNLSLESWDILLRQVGFSGVDFVREIGKDVDHHVGWIAATAVDEQPACRPLQPFSRRRTRILVPKTNLERSVALLKELTAYLFQDLGMFPEVLSIDTAATAVTAMQQEREDVDELDILLADHKQSYLAQLNATRYGQLKSLLERNSSLLWVSSGGGRNASPDHGMLHGLARTLRHEQPERHLVTLALDAADSTATRVSHMTKVIKEMVSRSGNSQYEQEYVAIDGVLHTWRLVEASDLMSIVESKSAPYQTVSVPCDGTVRFGVSCEPSNNGQDQFPHYVQTGPPGTSLRGDEVEINVRSMTLGPRDRPGSAEHEYSFGHCCSGIVLRVGPDARFQSGERVIAMCRTSVAVCSHMTVSSREVISIPEQLSFPDACSTIPPILAAFHTLFELGHVQPGVSVLVQNGATPLGQSALRALADHGITKIWTTAASEEESDTIAEKLGIPSEKILPAAWLESSQVSAPQWKSMFDVVLVTEVPKTTYFMTSVRSGGRVVITGMNTKSSKSLSLLTKACIPSNVSLSFVNLGDLGPSPATLSYAADKCQQKTLWYPSHGRTFPGFALSDAYEAQRRAEDHETFVVSFEDTMTVDVRRPKELDTCNGPLLSPEASYIIAGGLGGLGRAVSRWLVRHGARYLILLSRSGPHTTKALELLSELKEEGAHVEAPCCDISDEASLKAALASCSARCPPIKGCIQASMVLKVRESQEMNMRKTI